MLDREHQDQIVHSWDVSMSLQRGASSFVAAMDSLLDTVNSPHVYMRPRVYKWCALYGKDIQEGVVGFGDSPFLACEAFNKEWLKNETR